MTHVFKVIGVGKVFTAMDKAGKKLHKNCEKAITDEANCVLSESMQECPVLTGRLRRSGTVEKPKVTATTLSVWIGYHAQYAGPVHENLEARHKTGKSKYLEDPVNRARPGFADRVGRRMKAGGLL